MDLPRYGDLVRLVPTHDRVQNGESAHGRWMPMIGREVLFDRWWRSRLIDGDVRIATSDPEPPTRSDG